MYIKDGIAYAGEAVPELEVASARYVGNLQMVVTFVGGEERLLDATELSDMPALAPLMDEKVLEDFSIDHGVLTWLGGEIDIAPEAAYRRSFEYPRPARRRRIGNKKGPTHRALPGVGRSLSPQL